MATVAAYWRPQSIDEALRLLDRPHTIVLGGGTSLTERSPGPVVEAVEVVDLQGLRLDGIERAGDDALLIGAMTTLQQLVDDDHVPPVLREAARRERPSTLRNQATIGGCIASGDGESELLGALLVHDAVVDVCGAGGVEDRHLPDLLAALPLAPGKIITAVTIHTAGRSAAARTARTRADRAIVAAFVRDDGARQHAALTGVAATPILLDGVPQVDPVDDFRGSSEYRRTLAGVLLARAREAVA